MSAPTRYLPSSSAPRHHNNQGGDAQRNGGATLQPDSEGQVPQTSFHERKRKARDLLQSLLKLPEPLSFEKSHPILDSQKILQTLLNADFAEKR